MQKNVHSGPGTVDLSLTYKLGPILFSIHNSISINMGILHRGPSVSWSSNIFRPRPTYIFVGLLLAMVFPQHIHECHGAVTTGTSNNKTASNSIDLTISANMRDMSVTMGTVAQFDILSSKPVGEPMEIAVFSSNPEIATVSPIVTIKAGKDSVEIDVQTVSVGSCQIQALNYTISENDTRSSDIYVRIHVRRSHMLELLTGVFRWFYQFFFAVHLLPQIYLNYQRKSVVGLSFDYVLLSTITFFVFSIYNIASYSSSAVREASLNSDPPAPGVDLISIADVLAAILNLVIITATGIQCFKYEKGDQRVSIFSKGFFVFFTFAMIAFLSTMSAHHEEDTIFVIFIDILDYVKLLVAFARYVPQVYMNYTRKSTEGWSIAFAILDLFCGTLTICEMLIVARNYGYWISFFVSPTKLGIALWSLIFSLVFIIQHYILYRMKSDEDTIPIISSVDTGNRTLQASEDDRKAAEQEMKPLKTK